MRSNKGITLVSLVVTIIVLIILAGVSINLTLGENGIITIAKKARENMELAAIEEETKLNALYTQIELEDENIGEIDNSSIFKLIEFKQKVASAITDMGIETLETANADTMASNIRNISTNKDASSITYDNTSSGITSTNVQGAVDELKNDLGKDITNEISIEWVQQVIKDKIIFRAYLVGDLVILNLTNIPLSSSLTYEESTGYRLFNIGNREYNPIDPVATSGVLQSYSDPVGLATIRISPDGGGFAHITKIISGDINYYSETGGTRLSGQIIYKIAR